MLPYKEKDAWTLIYLSLFIAMCFALCLLWIVLLFHPFILAGLRWEDGVLLWLWPVHVLAGGIYQTFGVWLNRRQQYKWLAVGKVTVALSFTGLSISSHWISLDVNGLVVAHVVSFVCGGVVVSIPSWREISSYRRSLRRKRLKKLALRYREYPTYNSFTALLDAGSLQAPTILISRFFDSATVGLFNLTFRTINAPASMIGVSVSQLFYQRTSLLQQKQKPLGTAFKKTTLGLLAVAVPPFILLIVFAPPLFEFVFGSEWRVAGEYARILSIGFMVRFIVSPLSSLFLVLGRVKLGSIWQAVYFITTVSALIVTSGFGMQTLVVVYAIHECLLYSVYFLMIHRMVQKHDQS